jgi:phage tail P2-like protein
MSDNNILASAIADIQHFVAFDTIVKNRLEKFEVEKLLIYVIDTVDASALPLLAAQFDVLGYKGIRLAKTEEQQREVIKRAIELKRYKGTVWAVEEALKSIGYPDAVLVEHVSSGVNGWATFRIELNAGDHIVSADAIEEITKMVNEFKNTRSHLVDLTYTIDLGDDPVIVSEYSTENPSVDDEDIIFSGGDFKHNGVYLRNGEKNYSSDSDVLDIEIITV